MGNRDSESELRRKNAALQERIAELEGDIAARDQAAARRPDSNELQQAVLDSLGDAMHLVDLELRVSFFNKKFLQWCELLGLSTEPIGMHIQEAFPFLEQCVLEQYRQVIETGEPMLTIDENEFNGRVIITETHKLPLKSGDQIRGIITIVKDITERRLTGDSLRLTQASVDYSPDAVYWMGPDAKFLYVNNAAVEALGYSNADLLTMTVHDIGPDFPAALWPHHWADLKAQKSLVFRTDHQRKDGSLFPVEITANFLHFGGKEINCAFAKDITERKLAEAERDRLTHAIDQAAEAVVITDSDGTIQYVNPAFEVNTGYTQDETLGRNPRILKSGEQEDSFYADLWETLLRGDTWRGRIVNSKKDGSLFTEDAVISPVRDGSGKTVNYVAVKRDITDEIVREEQLRQAQKMESVGRLAGGVAHDFNNMLGVILGCTEMAMLQMDPLHEVQNDLSQIRMAAMRSADLTRQLLAFARKQTITPEVLDLNHTVNGMLTMLRRLIGEDITLGWRPGEDIWPVKVDPSQIDQVLANLCVNARDALSGGGEVGIETLNATLDNDFCAAHSGLTPGEYVQLAVSDNGSGMDAETLDNIFEPFFTTKGVGVGTGLGLSMVYGIVKQNGGYVTAVSGPGQGATFKIFLPRHDQSASPMDEKAPADQASRGDETVLLVEDEQAMLKMTARMLESRGYNVLVASRPADALRAATEFSGPIDLLMTDVIMPQMNGQEVGANLRRRRPDLKCLYMSGYTADVIAQHGVLDEGVHFIQKPFSMGELATKVREVLESK